MYFFPSNKKGSTPTGPPKTGLETPLVWQWCKKLAHLLGSCFHGVPFQYWCDVCLQAGTHFCILTECSKHHMLVIAFNITHRFVWNVSAESESELLDSPAETAARWLQPWWCGCGGRSLLLAWALLFQSGWLAVLSSAWVWFFFLFSFSFFWCAVGGTVSRKSSASSFSL